LKITIENINNHARTTKHRILCKASTLLPEIGVWFYQFHSGQDAGQIGVAIGGFWRCGFLNGCGKLSQTLSGAGL